MGFRRSTADGSARRTIGVVATTAIALALVVAGPASAQGVRKMKVIDRCDAATFNAMFGAGVCVSDKPGVPVDVFLSKVNPQDGGDRGWRFSPTNTRLHGQTLQLDNRGGETHTFTEVEAFGGGTLPPALGLLNQTLPPGTPLAVPIGDLRFIAAGQQMDLTVSNGTHFFECMIHPWMRTTVTQDAGDDD
jgi:hypothetical protein